MHPYRLTHVGDDTLLRNLAALAARDRATTAELLAHIAEVDARRLYLPAAYPSMHAYCVGKLRLSDQAASKRIYIARAARRFPAIFPAVADGRLHLSGLMPLVPFLTEATAADLLQAAEHKSRSEIEVLLARRFPRPDVPTLVEAIPPAAGPGEHSPGNVGASAIPHPGGSLPISKAAAAGDETTSPLPAPAAPAQYVHVVALATPAHVKPLAPERYALQVTIAQSTHDKLRHFQDLLGHQVPTRDIAQALDRALTIAIQQLERQKFAATSRPSRRRHTARAPRTVPAHVKRAVRARDGGQCTFVSQSGHRCESRRDLEFDHVREVARGGTARVENLRLRCRAHNQYTAECTFGAGFMAEKREVARATSG